jgi:hypothetical protein
MERSWNFGFAAQKEEGGNNGDGDQEHADTNANRPKAIDPTRRYIRIIRAPVSIISNQTHQPQAQDGETRATEENHGNHG